MHFWKSCSERELHASGHLHTQNLDGQHKSWFFTWTYALATASIVNGCLAERTNLLAYPIITVRRLCR